MYFFSAMKKGFISLLYLCTRNDDGSMAERSKAAHCSLGDEGDACQSENVLNRQVPEVLCEQSDQKVERINSICLVMRWLTVIVSHYFKKNSNLLNIQL